MFKNPISECITTGNIENFHDLIKSERNIRFLVQKDNLLHVACKLGHLEIVKDLIKLGVPIDQLDPTNHRAPLHEACVFGNAEIVEILCEISSAMINAIDKNQHTPAHICAMEGELLSLKVLVKFGAKLNLMDKNGLRPCHLAAKRNHSAIIKFLFDNGVDINEVDNNGRTALHYAANFNCEQALSTLLKCHGDLGMVDQAGYTPMHVAAKHEAIQCLRLMMAPSTTGNKGTYDIDLAVDDGKSPAHIAAQNGSYQCLHWLLSNGANISAIDNEGNTIGHVACKMGQTPTISCYLQHGGSQNVFNDLGEDLNQIARRFGHPLKLEKAVKEEVICVLCKLESNKRKWDQIHPSAEIMKDINQSQKTLYQNPLGKNAKLVHQHQEQFCEMQRLANRKYLDTINIGKLPGEQQRPPGTNESDGRRRSSLNAEGPQSGVSKLGYRDLLTRYYGENLHNIH